MSVLYSVIDPVVKGLLKSPLHGVMSSNTMVLSFLGRKSGKAFHLPISYAQLDGAYYAFTGADRVWWRNFQAEGDATLLVAGRSIKVTGVVLDDSSAQQEERLAAFLQAVPRDARPAGVRMVEGVPVAEDVSAAVERLVSLRFQVKD